jgi:hypothetical protein
MAAERRLSKSKKRFLSTSKERAGVMISSGLTKTGGATDCRVGRTTILRRNFWQNEAKKLNLFSGPVSAVWPTFNTLIRIYCWRETDRGCNAIGHEDREDHSRPFGSLHPLDPQVFSATPDD